MEAESRTTYKTRQKEELAKLLASVPDRHLTVVDICALLRRKHKLVGTTTVYRQIEKMVAEGTVLKHVTDSSEPATFEYIGTENCHDSVCYHCKCESCGKLIHVKCEELQTTEEHFRSHHGFAINPRRTVLYGLCEPCAARRQFPQGDGARTR